MSFSNRVVSGGFPHLKVDVSDAPGAKAREEAFPDREGTGPLSKAADAEDTPDRGSAGGMRRFARALDSPGTGGSSSAATDGDSNGDHEDHGDHGDSDLAGAPGSDHEFEGLPVGPGGPDSPGGGIGGDFPGGPGGDFPSAPGGIGNSPPSNPTSPTIPGHNVDEDKLDRDGHLSDDPDDQTFDSGSDTESEPILPGEKGPASPSEQKTVYLTEYINLCGPEPTPFPPPLPGTGQEGGLDTGHEDDGQILFPPSDLPIGPQPAQPPTPPDRDLGTGVISVPRATNSFVQVDAGVQQSVPFGSALVSLLLLFVMLF